MYSGKTTGIKTKSPLDIQQKHENTYKGKKIRLSDFSVTVL